VALIGAERAARVRPREALLARFADAAGEAIDSGLVLLFPAPHSYTGETVLELQGHGGPVVLQMLVTRCLEAGRELGLRLAQPGEFTRRAFLNDRLDLAQAEAVADLIDASTAAAVRSANRSLAGTFSREVHALAEALIELRTLVEATLDFPEEEIDFLQASDARGRLARVGAQLDALLRRAQQGALLRDGLNVVLVGAPNVGKSSLLNALAGDEVAIVTPIAGTTRDRIAQVVQVHGIPFNIIDTAGLRDSADEVERIGMARTLAEVERADVVLHLVDAAQPAADADAQALAQIAPRLARGVPLLTVFNKIDLTDQAAGADGTAIRLSARTHAGLDATARCAAARGRLGRRHARRDGVPGARAAARCAAPGAGASGRGGGARRHRARLRQCAAGAVCRGAAPGRPGAGRSDRRVQRRRPARAHLQPLLHRQVAPARVLPRPRNWGIVRGPHRAPLGATRQEAHAQTVRETLS
jgi:tRNA modification GTPase